MTKFVISLNFSFNLAFLTSDGNLVTSEKFLGSGVKCDTSKPDFPKVENQFFNLFITSLKTLCKPLSILFAESYAPIHSLFICLIRSHIFILASLVIMSGCIWL